MADQCTCQHYVVDYSDPERYHPENVDRELNSKCPEHGRCAHGNVASECTVGYSDA